MRASSIGRVYDTLVAFNRAGNAIPEPASAWTENSITEYTLKLRKGVTHEEGSDFTAESLRRVIKVAGRRSSSLSPIESLSTVNPGTLKEPDPDLLATLASSPGAMVSPRAFSRENLGTDPDGTVPYDYDPAKSVPGDHYTFTVNPKWWDASVARPHTVVINVLTDVTARLNAVKTGQVDIATITAQQATAAKNSGLKVASRADNYSGLMIPDRHGKTLPTFASPLVRQAMALALNRPALVKALSLGYALPSGRKWAGIRNQHGGERPESW